MAFNTLEPYTRVERADFPTDPMFSYDNHAIPTSNLASSIGTFLGLAGDELWMCQKAGLFHDLGRKAAWNEKDRGCARRSAALAEHVLKDDSNFVAMVPYIERVCRAIAQHDLDGPRPIDPVAIALHDADCLETARFAQIDAESAAPLIRKRYAQVITEWAKDPNVHTRWIKQRANQAVPGAAWKPGLPADWNPTRG